MLVYAKSIVATILGAVVPIITAAATHNGTLTSSDLITSVVTAVVSGLAVRQVPNAKAAGSALVVTLKTDVDKFLATFLAGLSALVEQAAQAAIAPTPTVLDVLPPAPAPVVAPPAPPAA
jgi:hypothetical protein